MTVGRRSPDGRFWWDGTAWRPLPPPPYLPPPPPSVPPPPPFVSPPPKKKRFLLPLIALTVPALLLGVVVGAPAGLFTTAVPGSTAAPAFPKDFPEGADRYLPGLTVARVAGQWLKKANSWRCAEEDADPESWSRAKLLMSCEPPDGNGDMTVRIEYDAPGKVVAVSATCRLGTSTKACTTLFSSMAHTAFDGLPKVQRRAQDWAGENAGSERGTVLGGVRIQADLQPHGMRITPEV